VYEYECVYARARMQWGKGDSVPLFSARYQCPNNLFVYMCEYVYSTCIWTSTCTSTFNCMSSLMVGGGD
jgi:hypothetical protein